MSEPSVKKPVLMPCGHPEDAVSYGDEGTNYCRWCEEVGRLEEQRDSYKKAYDDPEMDATEGAHPAWWRGEAYAAKKWQERCERAEAQAAVLREVLINYGCQGWAANEYGDCAAAVRAHEFRAGEEECSVCRALSSNAGRPYQREHEALRALEEAYDFIAAIAAPLNIADYGNGWATEKARAFLKEVGR